MEVRHASLVVDVPDDWTDHSTLLFLGPPEAGSSLPSVARVEDAAEAFSVSFQLEARRPRELLEEQSTALRGGSTRLEVTEEGPFESRLGEAHYQIQRLTMGERLVRQIAAVIAVGPVRILAVATAIDIRFDEQKERLWQLIRSLEVRSP